MTDDRTIDSIADRLGKLTVVGLQGNEAGALERYVRRSALVDLAGEVLAMTGPGSAVEHAAYALIIQELERAQRLHREFPTYHHALGIVREEYKELEAEVFKRDIERWAVAHELVQLGAMVVRSLVDLNLIGELQ